MRLPSSASVRACGRPSIIGQGVSRLLSALTATRPRAPRLLQMLSASKGLPVATTSSTMPNCSNTSSVRGWMPSAREWSAGCVAALSITRTCSARRAFSRGQDQRSSLQ